ncbi:hypothetical protein Godav_019473 [Gossypium davidsonii]|uniref:Uncharacterized protein n=1 Tax=Gossypium davidsonii TaxID=34287 RepID=A0A7J8QZU8_GOSDV|nr:hypothetical protein [Gossypium davidsonii]
MMAIVVQTDLKRLLLRKNLRIWYCKRY